jgi:hypothetical protein
LDGIFLMSIFERIKKAIFGDRPANSVATRKPAAPPERTTTAKPAPGAAGIPASPADAAWERREPIDVAAQARDAGAREKRREGAGVIRRLTSIVKLAKSRAGVIAGPPP